MVRSSSSFTSENVWNAWSFESQKQVFIQRAALLRPISMPPRSSHSPSRSSSRAPDYAVLVPLCVVNETPSILMTLRSSNLTRHKSEISFPGGKCERTDRDVVHTGKLRVGLLGVTGPLLTSALVKSFLEARLLVVVITNKCETSKTTVRSPVRQLSYQRKLSSPNSTCYMRQDLGFEHLECVERGTLCAVSITCSLDGFNFGLLLSLKP